MNKKLYKKFYFTSNWLQSLKQEAGVHDCKLVVQIKEVKIFYNQDKSIDCVILNLYDGLNDRKVMLDESLWPYLEKPQDTDLFQPDVIVGNVLFVHQVELLGKIGIRQTLLLDQKPLYVLVRAYTVIGYQEVVEEEKKSSKLVGTLFEAQVKPRAFCTNNVSNINEKTSSRLHWSIDLAVLEISATREIKGRNGVCRVRRYLVGDDTGKCEIVCFGNMIDDNKYGKKLKAGYVFRVEGAQVIKAVSAFREWSKRCTNHYDIKLNASTLITELYDMSVSDLCSSSSDGRSGSSSSDDDDDDDNKKNKTASNSIKRSCTNTSLNNKNKK